MPAMRTARGWWNVFAVAVLIGLADRANEIFAAEPRLVFEDAGDAAGLFPQVAGIAGHGVGWGDVDGDGWPDLYVGTFGGEPYGSKSNQFFRNENGKFRLDEQPALRVTGRANGAVFADFDNDGDLDLYATNHAIKGRQPHFSEPNHLFRNDGGGKFTDVSAASDACPPGLACRSVATADFDGDGRLDLLVGECFFQGGKSRSRLYRNLGELKFQNVTAEVGLPDAITGFGVAAGDVNGDGWPDLFVSGRHHGNRLFFNDGQGKFREYGNNAAFQWTSYGDGDDTTCGVCLGDVNRDGKLDLIIGSHFGHPWKVGGIAVRLYLQTGTENGEPKFQDVTEAAGLVPLPMKSPHLEVQDFDNDGWPDIYTSIVKFDAQQQPHPVIFRHGGQPGVPRYRETALAVNDFPTAEDLAVPGTGKFFDKMIADHKIVYMAPGPTADFDRDGRLDMFLANWWVEDRSLLLRNKSPGGNWLEIAVAGGEGVNRQGIGSHVRLYQAGRLGQVDAMIGTREIAVGFGYASGQEAIAHFGLGAAESCDVEIILPHGQGRLERRDMKANQRVTVSRAIP